MIFPIPKKELYLNATYDIDIQKLDLSSLIDFNNSLKECPDVNLINADEFGAEEYSIVINENGIAVSFSGEEGKFRAASSLIQLIKKQGSVLKYADIHDYPDFPRRGYMLDISRGRKPKMEIIKATIDYIASLKYNEFQLYMESFCFKYKHFPKYTEGFDCLTPDDIKELEAYCNERYIDLVPNQNSFGHMNAWVSEDEFKDLGEWNDDDITGTLNVTKAETLKFVDKLYDSLLPLFKSDYVNVGLDEAWGLGKYQTKKYCEKHGKGKVFAEYLNKIHKLTKEKYGKKMMYWADMLPNYDSIYDSLPVDAIALEWGYDLIQCQQMTEHCIEFASKNIPFYVCPSCNTHCSMTGRTDVMHFNLRTTAELGMKHGACGYLLTDWGDNGHPHFRVWSFVPIALGGQYSWNSGGSQVGSDFKVPFIRGAWEYADSYWFDGQKVSEAMSLMGNYYLLEKERVHNGTLSNFNFYRSLDTSKESLQDYEDIFSNDNIRRYMGHYSAYISSLPIDSTLKREINVNINMIILACEFGNIRLEQSITDNKKEYLLKLVADVKKEYVELWNIDNFEKGVEIIAEKFDDKIRELKGISARK